MYNVLRNIKDGLGLISMLLMMLATGIWVAVAFQKQSLGGGDWPDWLIILVSICVLLWTLISYKDIGEIMVNGNNPKVPKLYHGVFSALTVIGYGGGILFHFKPVIAVIIVAVSFTGKLSLKKWLKPLNA